MKTAAQGLGGYPQKGAEVTLKKTYLSKGRNRGGSGKGGLGSVMRAG